MQQPASGVRTTIADSMPGDTTKSLSIALSSEVGRQIVDGLHGFSTLSTAIIQALPALPDEEVLTIRDYATEIGSRAWQVVSACDWEITQRTEARRGRGNRDIEELGRVATIDSIAKDRNTTQRTIYRNAALHATFFAEPDENIDTSVNILADKTFFVAALEAPNPKAALQHFTAKKLEDRTYSPSDARQDVKAMRRVEQYRRFDATPLDGGPFSVIYADPPWQYEFAETENRAIENHYPTMTLDEICALDVASRAADDALLFLWATSPKTAEAMRVIASWGFEYRTNLVWVKDKIGTGYYARQQHELLLVARRGDFPAPDPPVRPASVIRAPRTAHSKKPEVVYELIDRMYPKCSKVELFCRGVPRSGWVAWGNEVTLNGKP